MKKSKFHVNENVGRATTMKTRKAHMNENVGRTTTMTMWRGLKQ